MMGVILLLSIALFSGIMTVFCLKGVDWVLISGVNMLPKEERQKFKEKHDMIAMNKFIGKRVFFPTTVLCLACVPLVVFDIPDWFDAMIVVAVIAVLVYVFSALPKILGDHFARR